MTPEQQALFSAIPSSVLLFLEDNGAEVHFVKNRLLHAVTHINVHGTAAMDSSTTGYTDMKRLKAYILRDSAGTVVHEVGHLLDAAMYGHEIDDPKKESKPLSYHSDMLSMFHSAKRVPDEAPSRYALRSPFEFFAEGFRAFCGARKDCGGFCNCQAKTAPLYTYNPKLHAFISGLVDALDEHYQVRSSKGFEPRGPIDLSTHLSPVVTPAEAAASEQRFKALWNI